MTEHQVETIEQITSRYPIVLLDNCAIQSCLEKTAGVTDKSIWDYLNKTASMIDFCGLARAGKGVYIAQETFDEFFSGLSQSYYKKIMKMCSRLKSERQKLSRVEQEVADEKISLVDAVATYFKTKRTMAYEFRKSNRVFQLEEKEVPLYSYFFKKNADLKQREYGHRNSRISDVDYILMIYAATASQTRRGSALITNDRALLLAWADFMKREPITLKEYGAYSRLRKDEYVKNVATK
jgi:hypothetical protein